MVGNVYWFSPVLGIESVMPFMLMSSKSCFEEIRGALILRDLLGSKEGMESMISSRTFCGTALEAFCHKVVKGLIF